MESTEITITHAEGVHARPASVFVREAAKFKSEITLTSDGTTVNGKSIMGLLMLALCNGAKVVVHADGPDEEEAAAVLSEILSGKF
ncbi:MAG: HPr family phosphocarrier protein [Leptospirales bacterium]|jgi:phosphotransferase system HPr (HPr) family protein